MLKVLERARYMEFTALFAAHADIAHLVVTFLAMLELAREAAGVDRADRALRADPRARSTRRARPSTLASRRA